MGNQAGIIIRNVKNELFHSAKRLILNEEKGIECLLLTIVVSLLIGHVVIRFVDKVLDNVNIHKIEDYVRQ